jgi:hypothetical protein
MEKYEKPVIEIVEFDAEDVITTSNQSAGNPPEGPEVEI